MSYNAENWKKVFDNNALKAFEADSKLHDQIIYDYTRYEIQRFLFVNDKLNIGEIKIGYDDSQQLYQIIVDNDLYSAGIKYSNLYEEIRVVCSDYMCEFEL